MTPAVAMKLPVVAPAATVVEAGTVSNTLLLDTETAAPPVGAAFESVTVHVLLPELVTEDGTHASELTWAGVVKEIVAVLEVLL